MSAHKHTPADRDPQQQPMPGDVLQVIPPFGGDLPKPMTVLAVTDTSVTWTRPGLGEMTTSLKIWRTTRSSGGIRRIVFATGEPA
ncbi:hypothetical protein [Stenotrophomonas sp. PS02297]|uniref:hypothetical protein n=1 Tax=Stenotrophomonas sp. PS02297 TaxID=2991423 RepID=UPI00249B275C|nr:hypothetical protein [Stenotrophomonas sp. PS02297]